MVGQIDLDALNRPKSSEHKKESPVEKKEPVKSEENKAEVKNPVLVKYRDMSVPPES